MSAINVINVFLWICRAKRHSARNTAVEYRVHSTACTGVRAKMMPSRSRTITPPTETAIVRPVLPRCYQRRRVHTNKKSSLGHCLAIGLVGVVFDRSRCGRPRDRRLSIIGKLRCHWGWTMAACAILAISVHRNSALHLFAGFSWSVPWSGVTLRFRLVPSVSCSWERPECDHRRKDSHWSVWNIIFMPRVFSKSILR
jgi:hypothetical protein